MQQENRGKDDGKNLDGEKPRRSVWRFNGQCDRSVSVGDVPVIRYTEDPIN